jgi:SnoaL-like domain
MTSDSDLDGLSRLARQIDRLTATRDIEYLILDQFDAADRGDFDRQADLLARAHVRYEHGDHILLDVHDRDEFKRAIMAATRIYEDGTPRAHHVVSNVVVDVDDSLQRARSRCYTTVLRATQSFPLQPIACGVFHDAFARDDGGWYFVDRLGLMRLGGAPSPPPVGSMEHS